MTHKIEGDPSPFGRNLVPFARTGAQLCMKYGAEQAGVMETGSATYTQPRSGGLNVGKLGHIRKSLRMRDKKSRVGRSRTNGKDTEQSTIHQVAASWPSMTNSQRNEAQCLGCGACCKSLGPTPSATNS